MSRIVAGVRIFACCILAGCGSSSITSNPPTPSSLAAPTITPAPAAATHVPAADDWTTYAHDQARTGFQSQNTGLTKTSVGGLQQRWKYSAGDEIYSSPLVYGGLVIFSTYTEGIVTALDSASGRVVWQRTLGGQVNATPTIADGLVFIGTHLFSVGGPGVYNPEPSNFYALNLIDGSVKWETPLAGEDRGSAVVVNGKVFVGISGGDPPTCLRGGVDAIDEQSGAPIWHWYVDPNATRGGSVWAPISFDGQRIITGTGNTCETPVMTANSIVALDPSSGTLKWSLLAQANSYVDDDTGGGVLLTQGQAFAINKNGSFYAVNAANGSQAFAKQLNPADGQGGWATPTTDGTTILLSSGLYGVGSSSFRRHDFFALNVRREASGGQSGRLNALDFAGNVKWSVATQNQIVGYAAINNGIGFASLDNNLTALDLSSGAKLWSFSAPAIFLASPAVVPSGVYAADMNGDVYAFSLASATSATSSSRR